MTYVIWVFFAVLQTSQGEQIPFMVSTDSDRECRAIYRAASDSDVKPVSTCEKLKITVEK